MIEPKEYIGLILFNWAVKFQWRQKVTTEYVVSFLPKIEQNLNNWNRLSSEFQVKIRLISTCQMEQTHRLQAEIVFSLFFSLKCITKCSDMRTDDVYHERRWQNQKWMGIPNHLSHSTVNQCGFCHLTNRWKWICTLYYMQTRIHIYLRKVLTFLT